MTSQSQPRPVALTLRLYRALARAFPYEFRCAYEDEIVQVTEDAIELIWQRHGIAGLLALLVDIAIRIPIEHATRLQQDIRYAARTLSKSTGYTLVALTSLSLGIAVATCGFSEVNGLILRDIPSVPNPAELVALSAPKSYPYYCRIQPRSDLFTSVSAYVAPVPFGVSLNGRTQRFWGHLATSSYFMTLGVHASLGNFFDADNDQPGRTPVVAVSYRFWQEHLGSDSAVIGKTPRVNGSACTLIGVGPKDFVGASPAFFAADLWLPLSVSASLAPELGDNALERRDLTMFQIVGRLKRGVTPGAVEAALDGIARQMEQDHGDADRNRGGPAFPCPLHSSVMESMLMNTRRDFMAAAAALPAARTLLAARPAASRVLGANDRINIGIIGVGIRGSGHCRQLKKMSAKDANIQVVAACEIYTKRKDHAKELLGLTDKDIHHDYRDLVNRPDVDAVLVATPDHWHFRMAMDAMLAGKDVYLEKPMTYKIEEAKVLAEHVKSSGRVMQIGSQYASELQTLKARDVVQKGLLGKVLFCQGTYSRNSYHGEWNYTVEPEGTPENIDWKRFLGSAPKRPFSADRYFRFRKYWDYSGGISTDLLYHRLVPFLAVLGPQFPVRVSANGGIYVQKDREVPDTMMTTIEYPDYSVMMLSSMASDAPNNFVHPVIYGHEAVMEFRGREVVVTPEPLFKKQFKEKTGEDVLHIDASGPDFYQSHLENFFDCMRTRKKPNLDADFGYKAMVAIGLGVEAYREQKQMLFDPATERIVKTGAKRETYEGDGKNVDETKA